MSEEQRRWSRHPFDVQVRFSIPREDGVTVTCTARGTDISEGGMAVIVKQDLRIGRQVRLSITLPGNPRAITAMARICNRMGDCFGMEFISLADADRNVLAAACQEFARKSAAADPMRDEGAQ